MEIKAFFVLVAPFILVFYLGVLLFMPSPKRAVLMSLLGGLVMGGFNLLFDLLAYYAHWWHYTLNDLIFHLPLPFYITPVFIYGSLGYLLIWRFWRGRKHWIALVLLIGIPIFGFVRDLIGWLTNSAYSTPDTPLAGPLDALMWVAMFYLGYVLFKRFVPDRAVEHEQTPRAA